MISAVCLALLAPMYFLPVFTPDEVWFYRDAEAIAKHGINPFSELPHLGYGSAFWLVYALMIRVTGSQMQVLFFARIVCFLIVASIPMLLIREGARIRSRFTLHCVLFWFSLPLTWWCGKIISPEIPSYALAIYAVLLVRTKPVLAWIICGFAVGLKLTALPAGALLWFLSADQTKTGIRTAIRYGVLGFVLANPVCVFHPFLFGQEMIKAFTPFQFDIVTILKVLFSTTWEWDGIPSGGIFVHGVGPFSFFLIIYLLVKEGRNNFEQSRWKTGLLLAWGFTMLIVLRGRFLIWYTFPAITLLPFAALNLTKRPRWVESAVLLQVLFGAPIIYNQYKQKYSNYQELRSYQNLRRDVDAALSRWKPDVVADIATVGRLQNEKATAGQEYLSESSSQYLVLDGPGVYLKGTPGKLAIVLNKRLMGLSAYYDRFLKQLDDPSWAGQYRLTDKAETETLRLFLFEAPTQLASSPVKEQPRN